PGRRQDSDIWRGSQHVAIVRYGLPGADAALEEDALAEPRVDADIEELAVRELPAKVAGQVDVVLRLTHERRLEVVEPANRVPAAIRQARIRRRGDAERIERRGVHRKVVRDLQAAVPPQVVAGGEA